MCCGNGARPRGAPSWCTSSAARYLARAARAFDLVFLDPPFAGQALAKVVAQLQEGGWLAPGCLVYLEHPRKPRVAAAPPGLATLAPRDGGRCRV